MEVGERRTRQGRKPLSDRTNSPLPNPTPSSSAKLPPPSPRFSDSTPAAGHSVEPGSKNKKKKLHLDSGETQTKKKKRRKFDDPISKSVNRDEGNKENVDTNIITSPDSPSTPSVRQPPSPLDEQLTVYARRQTGKNKGKEKVVVDEAFTCPPVERKRDESSKTSILKASKCRTDLPKKRRIKERPVSKDYIDQQRAYFAEIDRCELPVEEVSESELSDH
uniref:Sororin C-terminal region domain-containing protein n=1 Tax=Kalanchoe fedtschenkoi TaxID=63787 RepID=A0A7N0V409_KALFE